MRWLLMLICLAGMLRPHPLYARTPGVERRDATLVCGGTKFIEKSEFIQFAPVSQTITATLNGKKSAVPVDLRQSRIPYPSELQGKRGLTSFVSGWQCRHALGGHVLVLWYNCPQDLGEDVPQVFCSSTGEWERYVGLNGSLLDQGFSFEDSRYDALRARLGYHDKPDQAQDEGPFIWIH